MEVVDQVGERDAWSWRFLPTAGLLSVEFMPTAFRATRSPIPECRRTCGVPIGPADKTTSFLAVSVCLRPGYTSDSAYHGGITTLTSTTSSEFDCSKHWCANVCTGLQKASDPGIKHNIHIRTRCIFRGEI